MKLLKSHSLLSLANSYVIDSPQPSNLNYAWNFGSLLALCLGIQIVTGVTLAMHYTPNIDLAFISVEHIMRDVNYGWMIRYLHANTASFFFLFVYLHIGRGLYYGSYKSPRALPWSIGVIILILMMATAFLGILEICPKWLNNEMEVLFMTSSGVMGPGVWRGRGAVPLSLAPRSGAMTWDPGGKAAREPSYLIISSQLKSVLDNHKIKPIIVFEELNKEEVKENLRNKTRKKSGIYGIFNLITNDFYIGSAVTNKFYSRFYKHLIRGLGNKNIAIDLNKYGIESFVFIILEYFPEEVTKKNNPDLIALETYWIQTNLPSYNILLEAGNFLDNKHSEEIKQKIKNLYSDEQRKQIVLLNKD